MPFCHRIFSTLLCTLAFTVFFSATNLADAQIRWDDLRDPATFLIKITQKKCPDGFQFSASGITRYCLKKKMELPKAVVRATCDTIDDGRLSFSWDASKATKSYKCPEGANLKIGKKRHSCVFEDLYLPTNISALQPYCHYIAKGYFGFSYSL